MPVRKTQEKKATIGSIILNTPIKELTSKLVYVVLLIAFLVIGYLLGSLYPADGIEKKSLATEPSAQAPAQQAPQEPAAPDPEKVKKELKMGRFPVEGNENAKVTIVEFSDFECPFCARFYTDTLAQLKTEYIDTGKAKLYYRHFPLSFHPKAVPLAHAAECAHDQGAFWKMHDKIFENNSTVSNMTDDQIKQMGADLGLDTAAFNNCYDNKTNQKNIDDDTSAGSAVGVSGTPTFYINGKQLVGAQPFSAFKAIIDEELK